MVVSYIVCAKSQVLSVVLKEKIKSNILKVNFKPIIRFKFYLITCTLCRKIGIISVSLPCSPFSLCMCVHVHVCVCEREVRWGGLLTHTEAGITGRYHSLSFSNLFSETVFLEPGVLRFRQKSRLARLRDCPISALPLWDYRSMLSHPDFLHGCREFYLRSLYEDGKYSTHWPIQLFYLISIVSTQGLY